MISDTTLTPGLIFESSDPPFSSHPFTDNETTHVYAFVISLPQLTSKLILSIKKMLKLFSSNTTLNFRK